MSKKKAPAVPTKTTPTLKEHHHKMPVWINGEQHPSIMEAMEFLGVQWRRRSEFKAALYGETRTFDGFVVSLDPPEPRNPHGCTAPTPAGHQPLLRGNCVHRLGAYHGERV